MSYSDIISVETAICRVLENTSPLSLISLPLTVKLLGHRLAEDIIAHADFPPFRASIMDGYAVNAPLEPEVYKIQESIHAGSTPQDNLNSSDVDYITTGAMVPNGANAVVKVEDTELVEGGVRIKVAVKVGTNIRQIGSDIAKGEIVLNKGVCIGPTELGLLATVGVSSILCYRKPRIGVLSTGNELVECHEIPTGSQIRDSNRISLISSFLEEGHDVVDLGIVSDSKEVLRNKLLQASADCDVVVTSGGVSMGNADFVRPLLNELGTIHFCKLNMKPGKPTTFASYTNKLTDGSDKNTLFFGLPGNPVSCLVTKALFVDPALKRLQGTTSRECLHPQLQVRLEGSSITLDPERAEYHRAILRADSNTGIVYASSTGNQRSSRLLSMKSSNALLFLPKGPGEIKVGSAVTALVIGSLNAPTISNSVHPTAAALDKQTEVTSNNATSSDAANKNEDWKCIKTGLLTISDRASQGVYKDDSGPEMAKLLGAMSESSDWPLSINITTTAIVPDDPSAIRQIIEHWTDPKNPLRVDFLLTSGGTGFGLRDNTPEVVKPLLHREAPGVAQALLNEGLKFTPLAVMSRPVVGTRYTTFIATLPGSKYGVSVKAIRENITCLKALLPRIFELLKCDDPSPPPGTYKK